MKMSCKFFEKFLATSVFLVLGTSAVWAQENQNTLKSALNTSSSMIDRGENFKAASFLFNAYPTLPSHEQPLAIAKLTEALIKEDLLQSASFFFIRTLQSDDRNAIRIILPYLAEMLEEVGADFLRKYVLRHTRVEDYDSGTKSIFYYFMGKDELLVNGNAKTALESLSKVQSGFGVLPQATYLKGTAYSILGQNQQALQAFESCAKMASSGEKRRKKGRAEETDLQSRCLASKARVLYQAGKYKQADEAYDDIPKASFVWTDILFEQAWNAYALEDYNRSLGKLVTYRSPDFGFIFNPEVEVLRAQSFLQLCYYDEVQKTSDDFNNRYASVGIQLKQYLVSNGDSLSTFYDLGKRAFSRRLHKTDAISKALNRFVRGPYFGAFLNQERWIQQEMEKLQNAINRTREPEFGAFLQKVLRLRLSANTLLGGAFVKNSMLDLYNDLLAQLDKMSFIKLEMLKRSKTVLERKVRRVKDEDGNLKIGSADPERKDYQYYWSFNGEFWADELGDYVFALENMCNAR